MKDYSIPKLRQHGLLEAHPVLFVPERFNSTGGLVTAWFEDISVNQVVFFLIMGDGPQVVPYILKYTSDGIINSPDIAITGHAGYYWHPLYADSIFYGTTTIEGVLRNDMDEYEDNTAAINGGLSNGDFYSVTGTGVVMRVID